MQALEKVCMQGISGITFMSIDFEYASNDRNLISDIGISTISTDDLKPSPNNQKTQIISRRWLPPRKRRGRPKRHLGLFLFGETTRIQKEDITDMLKEVISYRSTSGVPNKVVPIGHTIRQELDIMENYGIDLRDQDTFSIEAIFDIAAITKDLELPFDQRPSLGTMLTYLGIPYQHLHNAGNDAHFTLKAFLMMAAMTFERMEMDDVQRAGINTLKSIALEPSDFDAPTADEENSRLYGIAKKKEALTSAPLVKLPQADWLENSDAVFLGSTFFGIDEDI